MRTRTDLVIVPNSSTPADRSVEKRRIRKHVVLNEVRRNGPLSRAEISKSLGYNLPSVSSLVDELIADGLVLEEEARAIPRGRRPIPIHLNSAAASVIGIDMGRRSTIGMMLNLGGEVMTRIERKTPASKTPAAHIKWAKNVAIRILETGTESSAPLCGVGIAIPGLVTKEQSAEKPGQELIARIRTELEDALGVAVLVQNDARMMALGSLWFGAGRSYRSFAVINIGHGVGMGLVLDGRVLTGKMGFAGEFGYVPIGERGVPGFLGHPDALENTGSGAGLLRMAKEKGVRVKDAAELAELARGGDRKAVEIFERFSQALGRGIATVINLFDLEAVILSGRVCRSSDVFFERMREIVRQHALGPIFESTRIQLSEMDVDLGPMGAAASVFHQIFHNSHVQVEEVI